MYVIPLWKGEGVGKGKERGGGEGSNDDFDRQKDGSLKRVHKKTTNFSEDTCHDADTLS